MAKKDFNKCRKWKDMERWAESHPELEVKQCKNHVKVYTEGCERPVTFSRGSGEPSPGLRKSIFKQLKRLGIALVIILTLYMNIVVF